MRIQLDSCQLNSPLAVREFKRVANCWDFLKSGLEIMTSLGKLLFILGCLTLSTVVGSPIEEERRRLIQLGEFEEPKWLSLGEIDELSNAGVNFMDVTAQPTKPLITHRRNVLAFPEQVRYEAVVRPAFTHLNATRAEEFLTTFSTFNNRYYTSTTGVQSSEWLLSQIQAIIASTPYAGSVSVAPYTHDWAQKSVIARIEGSDPTLKSQVVIVGAHQDSINSGSPTAGRSPGADDNGSGSAAILETFRSVLQSGFIPKRSIEWQWYSAEEVGLRGSQDIANAYNARGVEVASMLNFDIVGYYVGIRQMSLVTDFTDPDLTEFGRRLVEAYLNYTWKVRVCGYACSDHASFDRASFPAMRACEPEITPNMHNTYDAISTVNFEQVIEFAKFALAYAIELAEPHTTTTLIKQ